MEGEENDLLRAKAAGSSMSTDKSPQDTGGGGGSNLGTPKININPGK